jgi:folate-binding protein YgfZ
MNRTRIAITMSLSPEIQSQYDALSTGAGMADLSGRTLIAVTGADRVSFLHSFCTSDVKKLAEGQGCEAFVTNPQGKTIGHIYIFNLGETLQIDTAVGQAPTLIQHWERYVISEDVAFRDGTASHADLLLAGPKAAAILRQVGTSPPTNLPGCALGSIGNLRVLIKRLDFVGPETYFIEARTQDLTAIRELLVGSGATACGPEAVEIARIERGTPLFDVDITPDNLPQEIDRNAQAISFTKGCYLGQETVARIDALGHVNRLLVGVRIDGPVPGPESRLMLDGKEVGHVTSAAYSPKLGTALSLALIRRAQAKVGTQLTCSGAPAAVVKLPI